MTSTARLRLLLPLLLAAACDSGTKLAAAKFAGPSAVAAFRGFTARHAAEATPRPYVAVANLLRDELTLVDPLDDTPVVSATLSFPLSVPTRPRPFKLAAARLGDGGADLLVVASQSPPAVQLITTWTEEVRAQDLPAADDLSALYPGQALLSLAAVTRPGGGAWVFAGLSGGYLAVLEFERDPTSTLAPARRPIRRTALAAQQKDLVTAAGRFEPLDLAAAPDASRLFVATRDALTSGGGATVHGLGQLTVTGGIASSPWPVVGLDTRAPTRLVLAGTFAARTVASSMVFESPALHVFAVLDESGCGLRAPIRCGVATVVPDVGIAPDPAGELPYMAPIDPGASISSMTLAMPPAGGDAGTPVGVAGTVGDLMSLPPSATTATDTLKPIRFWQTALLLLGLVDGSVNAVDPGRWSPVNAEQRYDADRRLLVSTKANSVVTGAKLGLYDTVTGDGNTLLTDATAADLGMARQVRATAGYAPAETFLLAWQGTLPSLAAPTGILQFAGGAPVVAIQTDGVSGLRVDAPDLGVHIGDRVQVRPTEVTCAKPSTAEIGYTALVAGIRAPDATFPGGALVLSHGGAGGTDPVETACTDGRNLVDATAVGPVKVQVTVRVPGLVLSGSTLGYLGRPEITLPGAGADFVLQWQDETGLSGEALAIARKVRRRSYSPDPPCGAGIPGTETGTPPQQLVCACDAAVSADPLTPGPMLRFKIGVEGGLAEPGEGAALSLVAGTGITPVMYRPATRSAATGLTWLDGRDIDESRSTTVYAVFAADELIRIAVHTGQVLSVR